MRVDFAYAQARVQARLGSRLSPAAWRILESSRTLAQYLHAARATSLAPRLAHFLPDTPVHEIEGSLRREWRAAVAEAARWVPQRWRPLVEWTARLPDLPAEAYLSGGGHEQDWMRGRGLNETDGAVAGQRPDGGPSAGHLPSGTARRAETAAIEDVARLLRRHVEARRDPRLGRDQLDALAARLERDCARLLRRHRQQPAAVLCHLMISGLELWRLRGGLVVRALGGPPREGVPA